MLRGARESCAITSKGVGFTIVAEGLSRGGWVLCVLLGACEAWVPEVSGFVPLPTADAGDPGDVGRRDASVSQRPMDAALPGSQDAGLGDAGPEDAGRGDGAASVPFDAGPAPDASASTPDADAGMDGALPEAGMDAGAVFTDAALADAGPRAEAGAGDGASGDEDDEDDAGPTDTVKIVFTPRSR